MKKLSFITRTSLLLAFFFGIDKILAFGKSLLFNRIVGLEGMGIFGAANNIPDYLSALLSGGALGIAFIPVLRQVLDRDGRDEAWELFSRIINLAFLVTGFFSVVIILLAGPLVKFVIAPGFTPDKQLVTASLMRLDLVAILIFSISGLVMSGLQANQHFLLPALAPVLYNLGQIFGVTILSPAAGLHLGPVTLPAFGLGLWGMVYGVIIGAGLHLLIQVPGLIRFQYRWKPVLGLGTAAVQKVLILLGPRVLTMACIQAYFVARDNLASTFGTTGVGAMNLGWTIEQVPETILGTAIAVAILPSLADFITLGKQDDFTHTVNRALRVMLALCLPAAALLAMGVRPLAQILFGYDASRLNLVAACTWAFLFGLVGDTWLEVAVRSFYANQNTRTPLLAAFLQAVAFVFFALVLSLKTVFSLVIPLPGISLLVRLPGFGLGLPGIPLAAALTFTVEALVLLFLLNRRYPGLIEMKATAARALPAAVLAGALSFAVLRWAPLASLPATLLALVAGGLAALPLIWPELRLLLHL